LRIAVSYPKLTLSSFNYDNLEKEATYLLLKEIYMEINEITNKVREKFDDIKTIVYSDELEVIKNKCKEYLNLYKELCQILFCQNPFLPDQKLIAEAIFYKNLNDYERKREKSTYYRGNCSAFNQAINDVLNKLQERDSPRLRGLIEKYIVDSLTLINHYRKIKGNEELFQIWLTQKPDYSLYYDTCHEIIFGELYNDPSDQNAVSPALIRVMIELRLKWSMGISGWIVSNRPGNMRDFLNVYRDFIQKNKIKVCPRFDLIQRIYEWGNTYVHTGLHSYTWLPGFAINLLHPLFYGQQHRLSGVRVQSQAAIYEFWDELKSYCIKRSENPNTKVEIEPYQPGFICTDNNCNSIHCKNDYAIYEKSLTSANNGDKIEAAYEMKCILQKGIELLGNSLYKRVKESYADLRKKEIKERAYYLWLDRGNPLWDADHDWYTSIDNDITYLPNPQVEN